MADLEIRFDDHGLTRNLSSEMQKELPRALASSLNKMAFEASKDLKTAEAAQLHLTGRFIPNSTQYEAARSAQGANMSAEVGIMDRVKFAERLVEGGERKPATTKYIAVPVGVKRNGKGGVSKAMKPSAILSKPGYFVKEIKGVKGIWGVWEGHITLMYVLKPQTEYDQAPYLDFEEVVEDSASRHNFDELIAAAILKALGL